MKYVYLATVIQNPESPGPRRGGEISNVALFEYLAGQGHEVYVISGCGNDLNFDVVNGVRYVDLSYKYFHFLSKRARYVIGRLMFRYVAPLIAKSVAPDIVMAGPHEVYVAALCKSKFRYKSGVFIRAMENFKPEKINFRAMIKKIVYGDCSKNKIDELDFLVTNSEYMAERCREQFGLDNIQVIYPGVDVEPELNQPNDRSSRDYVVGMVSASNDKGYELFCGLAKRFEFNKFVAIADVPETGARENIVFTGWQANPYDVMSKVDILLVPSLWPEPFGRVVVEGILLGKVVLASDIGGIPEAINHSHKFLIEAGRLEEWELRLEKVLSMYDSYVEDICKMQKDAVKYSTSIQGQKFETFLLGLLDR